MNHRSWEWSTPIRCILTGWQTLFFNIADIHLSFSLLFMSIDCLNAFAMKSALRRLTDIFIYHFWWMLLAADLLGVVLQLFQALPASTIVINICWFYELFPPIYVNGHLILITICDMISGSIYLCSIVLLILNRSQYDSVRAAQVKRQLGIMRQIVVVVSFCIVFQLIPFLFVMVSIYFQLDTEVIQVHLWTIQTFGFAMVPLFRLTKDPTARKLLQGRLGLVAMNIAFPKGNLHHTV
ncbi:hypothetical protein M514_01536 [Trichuris suis]|uniref:G-protein coupled receptors family 1 profile domain-containing protein n=1 Tax=Trichuris suis TaxID=68888 RepID=A0A085MJN7_9BILA|nr:hypothetical protein M513_01536 [Trichuris suis]KFD66539.1 hypothetical protein M514_01536 [Trichuris suis]